MKQIIIIGAGLAGLSAARFLASERQPCVLLSESPSERSLSVLAEGGINAALDLMGEGDSPEKHFEDTMKSAQGLTDPEAVRGMTLNAPAIVKELLKLGVPFQRENGQMIQRFFGGQKKRRAAFAKSSTGKALVSALVDEVRKYEARGLVERLPHHRMLTLAKEGSCCQGVFALDTWMNKEILLEGPVLLCFGGPHGMFPGVTTGSVQNTGDALAELFSLGVELADLEYIQFHPTTLQIEGKRLLISEAARGEGARLFCRQEDGKPWYFMEELYPETGNLSPRDVVSKEMERLRQKGFSFYLDFSSISKSVWANRLSDMRSEILHYTGKDPAKESIPVSPGIHYFMGGILVDREHRTSFQNLYAAGECACIYHGANRLGGNSLLGAIYGGQRAARTILKELAKEQGIGNKECQNLRQQTSLQKEKVFEDKEAVLKSLTVCPGTAMALSEALLDGMAILREEKKLLKAKEQLMDMLEERLSDMERKRVYLGLGMLLSALERKESRGAHQRIDYSESREAFCKMTVAKMKDGEIEIDFKESMFP